MCTGALLLGAAGILDGLPATTHWASAHRLADYGAEASDARIVPTDRVITAAGVSAGIDLGLHVAALAAGKRVAEAIRLIIEYDRPVGSAEESRPVPAPETVARAREMLRTPFAAPPPGRSAG